MNSVLVPPLVNSCFDIPNTHPFKSFTALGVTIAASPTKQSSSHLREGFLFALEWNDLGVGVACSVGMCCGSGVSDHVDGCTVVLSVLANSSVWLWISWKLITHMVMCSRMSSRSLMILLLGCLILLALYYNSLGDVSSSWDSSCLSWFSSSCFLFSPGSRPKALQQCVTWYQCGFPFTWTGVTVMRITSYGPVLLGFSLLSLVHFHTQSPGIMEMAQIFL